MPVAKLDTVCTPVPVRDEGGLLNALNKGASLTGLMVTANKSVSLLAPSWPVAPLSFVTIVITEAIVSLTITAHDGAMSFSKVLSLGVEAAPVGWSSAHQWRLLPADVNADGFVAPLDALLIIIDLNSGGARSLSNAAAGTRAPLFVDVSGDGFLAPDDALGVINWLNAEGVGAGEFVGTETSPSEATTTSVIPSAPQWIALESRVAERVLGVTSDDVWKMAFEQVERERYWRFDPLVLDVEYVRDGAAKDDAVAELFDLLWADEVQ